MSWSKAHDRCVACGTTETKHKGHGYCRRCHFAWRYRSDANLRDAMLKRAKAAYLANPDKVYERTAKYRSDHPEAVKAWQSRHREKVKALTGAGHSAKFCKGVEFTAYGRKFTALGKSERWKGVYHVPAVNEWGESVRVPNHDVTEIGPKPSLFEVAC